MSALLWPAFANGHILKPYQADAAEFLAPRKFALLAAKPRLGKTYATVAALDALNTLGGLKAAISCPPGVASNWRAKIKELSTTGFEHWVVPDNQFGPDDVKRLPSKLDVWVVDESHRYANRESQRTVALYGEVGVAGGMEGLVARADTVWCESGTPILSYPNNLWTMIRRFAPQEIIGPTGRPMSFHDFEYRFCATGFSAFGTGRKVTGARNVGELKKILNKFTLIQDYSLLKGVPKPPDPDPLALDVDAEDLADLKLLETSDEGKAFKAAVEKGGLQALKKLPQDGKLRKMFAMAKAKPLAELVAEELENDPDSKQVIAAWHTGAIRELTKHLKKYGVAVIDGHSDKEEAKRRFQNDPKTRVCVIQIAAAAEGIDLSAADTLTFLELCFSPGLNEQAGMRIWNTEKVRPLIVRAAEVKGTIDQHVNSILLPKNKAINAIFS